MKKTWVKNTFAFFSRAALLSLPVHSMCLADGRDPTQPLFLASIASDSVEQKLELQAVFAGRGRNSSAIINGRTMELGQYIDIWQLARIEKGQVLLRAGERQQVLRVHSPVNLRP